MNQTWWSRLIFVSAIISCAGACAPYGGSLPTLPMTSSINESYVLGSGDRLQIQLYGVNDTTVRAGDNTPGQYVVSEAGTVDAPLIGVVNASGLTVAQLKQNITAKLAQGYINDPKVGVDILSYRPFYIIGEVNHPGAYPCTARSRVLSAVAIAGGYTYRANEDFAVVERRQGDQIITGRVGPDTPILPDDVVRITQRYF